jgi:predicted transcriptional regulator
VAGRSEQSGKLLGPLEAQLMDVVWSENRAIRVREAVESLNRARDRPLAYTTVMTVMNRLVDKDVLRRSKEGRGYVYEAVAEDAAGIAVHGVLRDYGDAAIAHFLEEARADPEVLRRLQRLVEDAE